MPNPESANPVTIEIRFWPEPLDTPEPNDTPENTDNTDNTGPPIPCSVRISRMPSIAMQDLIHTCGGVVHVSRPPGQKKVESGDQDIITVTPAISREMVRMLGAMCPKGMIIVDKRDKISVKRIKDPKDLPVRANSRGVVKKKQQEVYPGGPEQNESQYDFIPRIYPREIKSSPARGTKKA